MIEWINQYLFGSMVPILLMAAGVFYGIRLKFFHLLKPKAVLRALTEKQNTEGVTPFRALTLALAGTLGVGNIVGVSAAIAMGGFGAVFWMWISALCAMLLKYAEIVLAMLHRRTDINGKPHGSAMYYIRDLLHGKGHRLLGGALAGIFAILCIMNSVTMGSVIQVNAICNAFSGVFHVPPLASGIVLAVITGIVIRKGSDGILRLTEKMVPLMTLGYLILSAAVLVLRADLLGNAVSVIFRDALRPNAAIGGIGGFLLSDGVRYGTMRGLISNEAGCGTAPTAHAVSDCREPAKQGVWGIFEVFADTIVLCTVTALVVIVSYPEASVLAPDYMMMTVTAYSAVLGDFAAYFMSVAVLFFGFATILCWAHYGMESTAYLSGSKLARTGFRWVYTISVFVGSFAAADVIWQAADFAVGAMTLINVSVICVMNKEVKRATEAWVNKVGK